MKNAKINLLTNNWYTNHAYSSWEKGGIKQKHRQFRKFFPKGKSFKNLTQKLLDKICLIINVETFLQKGKRSKINKTLTNQEIDIFKKMLEI